MGHAACLTSHVLAACLLCLVGPGVTFYHSPPPPLGTFLCSFLPVWAPSFVPFYQCGHLPLFLSTSVGTLLCSFLPVWAPSFVPFFQCGHLSLFVPSSVGMPQAQVIAKLEDLEGLVGHGEVINAADAILFSRGSLGTCLEPEKVRYS
jgi:hypothetical protein